MDLWTYERACWQQGDTAVCGVDEAGAGPLAGPVYAAAVILPPELEIPGLNDSKKLTEKKREALFDIIVEKALFYSIARVEAAEIDEIDILNARMKAMQLAIDGLGQRPGHALIDGNRQTDFGVPSVTVVHGDAISQSIAAASVLAKVTRDRQLIELDKQYPEYGFARNKGYGTAEHIAALKSIGPCPDHRRSFIRNFCHEESL